MTCPDPPPTPEPLLSHDEGAVRVVTLNRPERRNAFTPEGYRLLAEALNAAERDRDVHVVVLRGAGSAFSSGVDLEAFAAAGSDHSEFTRTFDQLVSALADFSKPLLAAVRGPAVGFGFTILLHCDVVVAARDARLRAPFTRLGMTPEAASSWLLPKIVGAQRAAELLLSSRWLCGDEAAQIGLAARAVPADELWPETLNLAQQMAGLPLPSLIATKSLLREGWADQVRRANERERTATSRYRDNAGPARADERHPRS